MSNVLAIIAYHGGMFVMVYGTVQKELRRDTVKKRRCVRDSLNALTQKYVSVPKAFVMNSMTVLIQMTSFFVMAFTNVHKIAVVYCNLIFQNLRNFKEEKRLIYARKTLHQFKLFYKFGKDEFSFLHFHSQKCI